MTSIGSSNATPAFWSRVQLILPLIGWPLFSSTVTGVAFGHRAIEPDHHAAGRDILDQAKFAAVVDQDRADPIKRHVPLAVATVARSAAGGASESE